MGVNAYTLPHLFVHYQLLSKTNLFHVAIVDANWKEVENSLRVHSSLSLEAGDAFLDQEIRRVILKNVLENF